MQIKNQNFKRVYRIAFLLICEAGLVLQYAAVGSGARMLINYYTVLSNMLCFVYFACIVGLHAENEKSGLRGAVTIAIAITGIVYNTMLSGAMEGAQRTSVMLVSNAIVHCIVPIAVVLDYFLFSQKGRFKWYYPFLWTIIPYIYLAFTLIRANVSDNMFKGFGNKESRFPYPFIDIDVLGVKKVLLIVAAMTVAVIALGFILFGLDRLMYSIGKKKETEKMQQSCNT